MGTGSFTVKVCLANTLEFLSCDVVISYGININLKANIEEKN